MTKDLKQSIYDYFKGGRTLKETRQYYTVAHLTSGNMKYDIVVLVHVYNVIVDNNFNYEWTHIVDPITASYCCFDLEKTTINVNTEICDCTGNLAQSIEDTLDFMSIVRDIADGHR